MAFFLHIFWLKTKANFLSLPQLLHTTITVSIVYIMIKNRLWVLLFIFFLGYEGKTQGKINLFSGNKIELFSEISYSSIPAVNLNEYKSVQKRDHKIQNPNIALGVGISGGGSRAQFFSLGVLLELEEIRGSKTNHNFLNEIDYFSTVSGGCFSAGYYLTILKNKLSKENQSFNDFYFSKADAYKSDVDKTANAFSLLYNGRNERGEKVSMCQRLDLEVLQYDSSKPENPNKFQSQMILGDFFIPKESTETPKLPMFVANAAVYNNGERFPFMPHIISAMQINTSLAPNLSEISTNSQGFNDGYNFPLTYAITASSAFPGVLPKVKFGIKNDEKILCLVDGGCSENTGYKTLIELLTNDTSVKNENKKALFIDCLGEGKKGAFINDQKIKLVNLLETATLYTVLTKYITFDKDLKTVLQKNEIPTNNYQVIGFATIRDYLSTLKKDEAYTNFITQLKNTNDTESNWNKLFEDFRIELFEQFGAKSFKKDETGLIALASLNRNKFKDLTATQILVLYEYAAQIETKLKITQNEKEMLLLSGRFAAYLKEKELKELLVEN